MLRQTTPTEIMPDLSPTTPLESYYALGRNLLNGWRLACGLPLHQRRFTADTGQLLMLALLLLTIEFILAFARAEPPRAFNPYGMNYLAGGYFISLLLLLPTSRLAAVSASQFSALVTAVASAQLPLLLFAQLFWWLLWITAAGSPSFWTLLLLLVLWQTFIVTRILLLLGGSRGRHLLQAAAVFALGTLGSHWILPQSVLWYTDYQEPPDPLAGLNVEQTYYAQSDLLQQNLNQIAPQRPGITDLYLVTLAGYGRENVFLKEAEYVRSQFADSYGTGQRSLLLANNPDSLKQYPLASGHNLTTALKAIARRMDTDEDILLLFMTSHGSADHRFSLDMGPMQLNDLSAPQLRQALDNAGIRWRLIIVSSCYSGGFIEPLQSPDSLVITAAAPDRPSFGCGATSEFTYFGNAYFRQALPRQPRFIEAFDLAKQWVTEREQHEGFAPSRPQLSAGSAISAKLERFYQQPVMQSLLAETAVLPQPCALANVAENCRQPGPETQTQTQTQTQQP